MRLNLSMNGSALADPEYVRMVAPQFEPRKKVSGFCVRLRASEPINALLPTVGLYCGCLGYFVGISVPGKGGIRLRRSKTYYLDRMDQLSSSELGEYPTYIIRLSPRFVWGMHHKSTVLEILSEFSEDPT